MTRILLSGCCGKMGRNVISVVNGRKDCEIVAGIDIVDDSTLGFPVFQNYGEVNVKADVIIDFSNPALLSDMLAFAVNTNTAVVLATTGYNEVDDKMIEDYARFVPIFKSSNMSEGVSVMLSLIRKALPMLVDWDIEIVEKHHKHKKDAPSGTAKMMVNEVLDYRKDSNVVYGRNPESPKRDDSDIGVSAIRGGGCAGEHEIGFYSDSEIITIKHEAFSRDIFAKGALKAGKFIVEQKPGLYTMRDIYKD